MPGLKALAIGLALLDFAPVFFLALGLFFLAQLVDRLEPRCRQMALAALVLITLGGLARAASQLAFAVAGEGVPLLETSLHVFGGPGFALMAAALIRARATEAGRVISRDPWVAPTALSWLFLGIAYYLNSRIETGLWSLVLVILALAGSALMSLAAARLGWRRELHMAAAFFAMNAVGSILVAILRPFDQNVWIHLVEVILNLASQAAFTFAAWRVAAEFNARVGPTAAV